MKKWISAIELGSRKVKMLIGYEIDNRVQVIYTLVRPYGHSIESGTFTDMARVIETLKEIKNIRDESVGMSVNIAETLFVLPPYGLEVYQTKQITTVVGEDGKVDNLDIRNLYSLIRNRGNRGQDSASTLVDIVPDYYSLDRDRNSLRAPIGDFSSTLTINAKVHKLPSHIHSNYLKALNSAGINAKACSVAPLAAAEYLKTNPEVPNDYLLVDIGSDMTTVSLIGGQKLWSSCFFEWGGHNITDAIVRNFGISHSEAEKIKIIYGIDERNMEFRTSIFKKENEEGSSIEVFSDDLNSVIKSELDKFLKQLDSALSELLKDQDQSLRSLPIILVGGGSNLNGLVNYILPKISSESAKVVNPKTLGARDATFLNCLGMIMANHKYPNVFDENNPKLPKLTREK